MNASVIAGIVRHLLGIASGYLVAKGIDIDGASVEAISGGIGALVAIAWSAKAKKPVEPKPLDN